MASVLGRSDYDAFFEALAFVNIGCLISYIAMALLIEVYLQTLAYLGRKELDIASRRLASIRTPRTRVRILFLK